MSALANSQKKKGEAFLSEAESTLKKSTWFASSTERKHEDGAELCIKAAKAFKVGGITQQGRGRIRKGIGVVQNSQELGRGEQGPQWCGDVLQKGRNEYDKAIECWSDAVTLLCDAGRLNMAAKLSKEIAEALENNLADNEGDNTDSVAAAI